MVLKRSNSDITDQAYYNYDDCITILGNYSIIGTVDESDVKGDNMGKVKYEVFQVDH